MTREEMRFEAATRIAASMAKDGWMAADTMVATAVKIADALLAELDKVAVPVALPMPDENGWVRHDRSKCPVRPDTLVEIRMRSGETFYGPAGKYWWGHNTDYSGDIVAYRVVP